MRGLTVTGLVRTLDGEFVCARCSGSGLAPCYCPECSRGADARCPGRGRKACDCKAALPVVDAALRGEVVA